MFSHLLHFGLKEISRALTVRIKEHKYNLTQGYSNMHEKVAKYVGKERRSCRSNETPTAQETQGTRPHVPDRASDQSTQPGHLPIRTAIIAGVRKLQLPPVWIV
jgi:hypothetical protein